MGANGGASDGYPVLQKEPEVKVAPGPREKHNFDYLILGGGNVAGYAAREFVKVRGGPLENGEVAIITEEAYHPYERPALSKGVIMGKAKLPGFHTCAAEGSFHTPDWYEENNITVWTKCRCNKIDLPFKTCIFQEKNFEVN